MLSKNFAQIDVGIEHIKKVLRIRRFIIGGFLFWCIVNTISLIIFLLYALKSINNYDFFIDHIFTFLLNFVCLFISTIILSTVSQLSMDYIYRKFVPRKSWRKKDLVGTYIGYRFNSKISIYKSLYICNTVIRNYKLAQKEKEISE